MGMIWETRMNPKASKKDLHNIGDDKLLSQSIKYASLGAALGLFAPVGWIFIDTIFFSSGDLGFFNSIRSRFFTDGQGIMLLLYMLFGTSIAMCTFGYLIGRKNLKLLSEEKRMSETYKLFMQKEELFEKRHFHLHNRMRGITNVSASIQRSADMDEVFRICADGIHKILDFDRVNVFLVNRESEMLECQQTRGSRDEKADQIKVPLNEAGGILNLTIKNDQPYIINGPDDMKPEYRLHPPYDSIKAIRSNSFMLIPFHDGNELLIPFHDGNEPVGLFAVDNKFKKVAINEEEVDIIKVMADQTSVAISNIRLIHGIRRMDELMEQAFTTIKSKRERYSEGSQKLAVATTNLREAADSLASDAEEVLAASDKDAKVAEEFSEAGVEISTRMSDLISATDEIAMVVRDMKKTLGDIEERAEESAQANEVVSSEVDSGTLAFQAAGSGIENLEESTDSFSRTMEDLSRRSADVKEMIQVIDDVMDQTKLLALNASIIAAQAGTQGKSFAVVAEEIGKLSRDVEGFTGKIGSTMDAFEKDILEVVQGTEKIRSEVKNSVENFSNMEGVFQRISDSFKKSHDMSMLIRDETVKQAGAATEVVQTTDEIRGLASTLKEGADQHSEKANIISRSSEDMKQISHRLTDTARTNQAASRTLLETVSESEQVFETLFVSLQEWRELGRDLLKELETFGV
ncbi:GAF domain-containing protein [bacterium]|nr:MAG: GAF domain-containing protein [bacterium]